MNTAIAKVVSINSSASTDDVRRMVLDLMRVENISQSTVGKEAGLSSSVVSQWIGGTYQGNNDSVAAKLVKWINGRSARDQINAVMPKAPAWIEAPTAKRIYAALSYGQTAGDIVCIYGGAGLSKTTTIRRYRERNSNVWVVTATPPTAGAANLLQEIAMALNLRDFPLHPHKLLLAILQQVRDSGGMLIIDEAQHLTKQALETARSIHDAADGTIGLALAGNAAVYNTLFKNGDNGFAQIFSRIGKRVALARPMAGDVHALAAAFGVSGTQERRALEAIAQKPGALRMMVKTLRLAAVFAAGAPISREHIDLAYRDMQGEAPAAQDASEVVS